MANLPILGTALAGWRTGLAAAGMWPGRLLLAIAINTLLFGLPIIAGMVVGAIAAQLAMTDPAAFRRLVAPYTSGAALLFPLLVIVATAPLLIRCHRLVILGEASGPGHTVLGSASGRRYVGYMLPFGILAALLNFIGFRDPQTGALLGPSLSAWLTVALVSLVLWIRCGIVLPAIATEAPEESWANAWRDTRPQVARILGITACAAVPTIAATYLLVALLPILTSMVQGIAAHLMIALGGFVVLATITTFTALAFAAINARIFLACADTLGHPPRLQPSASPAQG